VRELGLVEFILRDLDADRRAGAFAALRATIDAHETPDGVLYPSAAWITTARREADRARPPRSARPAARPGF
jgi:hypothetical protein